MKITCDTEIGQLINIGDISKELNSLSNNMKPVLVYSKVLNKESMHGKGLSKEALSVEGKSFANIRTIKQLNNLETFYSAYGTSRSQLIDATTNQRRKELIQLRNAVEAKIVELENTIKNINNQLNPGIEIPLSIVQQSICKTRLQTTNTDLIKYRKKLKLVEAELGRV